MGIPLSDDLRRKILYAYDQGEGTLGELADRFHVSLGWAKKISAARNRTGQAERVPHHPGRKPKVGSEDRQQVKAWFVAQPDLTLSEVRQKLLAQFHISLSMGQVWQLVRKLGLRLKKSRSTRLSATPKPTANSARSLSPASGRSARRG